MARPTSLADAMAMAQLFEERIEDLTHFQKREGGRTFTGGPGRVSSPATFSGP